MNTWLQIIVSDVFQLLPVSNGGEGKSEKKRGGKGGVRMREGVEKKRTGWRRGESKERGESGGK